VQVDVWHCDAGGLYSDEAANNTVGKKFLRGYQITDANGAVQFTTIYPGWYSGRTIHIHFRIRTFDGSTTTSNFTSQLFFDETITNTVLAQSPYNTRGTRDTTNATDNIYSAATLLSLTSDGSGGYAGTFTVALDSLPAGTQTPAATGSPTPTSTPTAIGSPAASCSGDCNAGGQASIDELVTLVDITLGNTQTSACANGIRAAPPTTSRSSSKRCSTHSTGAANTDPVAGRSGGRRQRGALQRTDRSGLTVAGRRSRAATSPSSV
jgi:intradiol ring-cleaving dioxygenase-like protein